MDLSTMKTKLLNWRYHAGRYGKSIVEPLSKIQGRLARIEQKLDLMEHFGHGARATYVGDNRVLMKCVVKNRQIAFLLEADDRLLSPWFIVSGHYELSLTNYFTQNLAPNSRCIDVGSNFGYFSCLMARFCPEGKVIGVEADEKIFELARDNILINGFNGFARIEHAAASDDSTKTLTLYRRGTRSGNTSIIKASDAYTKSLGEPPAQAFDVRCMRVDDLLAELQGRVDFMKVDVEGAEPLVFRGAKETIAKNPNIKIVMEWSPLQIRGAGFDIAAFMQELRALDLKVSDIREDGSTLPMSFEALVELPYRAGVLFERASART